MKKSILMSVMSAIAILAGSGSAQADVPMSLPFLTSKSALRSYAIEQSRRAELQINSPGILNGWPWWTGTEWDGSLTSRGVVSRFENLALAFQMVNVDDYVIGTGMLENSDGEVLFSAQSYSRAYKDNDGSYKLPQMYFDFDMTNVIPVKVGNSVVSAEMDYLSDDGYTILQQPISVANGKLYFDAGFAGRAYIILGDKNGQQYEYDLRTTNGTRTQITTVAMQTPQSTILNVEPLTDPSLVDRKLWSWHGHGENTTFELSITRPVPNQSPNTVIFHVYTSEGAFATGYYVRPQGGTNWTFYPASVGTGLATVPLGLGDSYVVPAWNPQEFEEWAPAVAPANTSYPAYDGKG